MAALPPKGEDRRKQGRAIRDLQRRMFCLGRAMVKAGNFLMRMNDCGPDDPWYRKSLAINMIMKDKGTECADAVLDTW